MPSSPEAPNDKSRPALERLAELMGAPAPASLEALGGSAHGLADLEANLRRALEATQLPAVDKLLVAVAVASACGAGDVAAWFAGAAEKRGATTAQALDAVAVASVCATFNTYHSFRDMAQDAELDALRAPFVANSFMKGSLSPAQVEAICVAVSAVNHCVPCVRAHVKKARGAGLATEQIDEALRMAAAARGLCAAAAGGFR